MAKHGYIVLPPGHGKSHLHSFDDRIIEADTIVPCKLTHELKRLRQYAKESGEWREYDRLWTDLINNRIADYNCVILVPTDVVGEAGGWICLGGAILEKEVWVANLANRGDTIGWFNDAYRAVHQTFDTVFQTNDELQAWVRKTVKEFLA